MRDFLREHGIVLGPRELRILQAALDKAWEEFSANHPAESGEAAAIRRQLAQKLIRLRQAGARDPKRMATLAHASVEAGLA